MKIDIKYEIDPCCGQMETLVEEDKIEILYTIDEDESGNVFQAFSPALTDEYAIEFCPFCGDEITWEVFNED